jgi:hypothetical protein
VTVSDRSGRRESRHTVIEVDDAPPARDIQAVAEAVHRLNVSNGGAAGAWADQELMARRHMLRAARTIVYELDALGFDVVKRRQLQACANGDSCGQ